MKNIAIFGSGKGSNAENIINYFTLHKSVSIKLIITNNENAGIKYVPCFIRCGGYSYMYISYMCTIAILNYCSLYSFILSINQS